MNPGENMAVGAYTPSLSVTAPSRMPQARSVRHMVERNRQPTHHSSVARSGRSRFSSKWPRSTTLGRYLCLSFRDVNLEPDTASENATLPAFVPRRRVR
jgi:hypothetical protein